MTKEILSTSINHDSSSVENTFSYDAFISYSTRTDYHIARRMESFLESFHKTSAPSNVQIRRLQICRDGSDFKLPANREKAPAEGYDPVWEIILGELSRSRYLIVLCSPGAVSSTWVPKEVSWMVENRGPEWILPVVTAGDNPSERPEECFPPEIIASGIHKTRIWYDLRGLNKSDTGVKVRDTEDEMVRVASDLLDWDANKNGPLAAIWEREQLKRRRRQATITTVIATVMIIIAVFAIWRSVVATRESRKARSNALVLAANASPDPLVGALLLNELEGYDEPDNGMRVAQKLASMPIPQSVMRGHTQQIVKVAFSQDATRLLTVSDDGLAQIWPVYGRGNPTVLRGHSGALTDATFAPDGSLVATASKDATARIWGEESRDAVRVLDHAGSVLSVRFSSDGEWLATVCEDGTGQLWRVRGTEKLTISLPDNRKVMSIWLSDKLPAGLAAARDGSAWSFEFGGQSPLAVKQVLPAAKEINDNFSDSLERIRFSLDGSHLAAYFHQSALVRRLDQPSFAALLPHNDLLKTVELNADGSRAVTACSDGKVRIWQTATAALLKELDTRVRVWTIDLLGKAPDVNQESSFSVRSAWWSPDGKRICAFYEDLVVRLWDSDNPGAPLELQGHPGASTVAFSNDGALMATGADDGTARVWPLSSRVEPFVLQHTKSVHAARFSNDGRYVATASGDGVARIWSLSDPSKKVELNTNDGAVRGFLFSKTGSQLITANENGKVRLWNISDLDHPALDKELGETGRKLSSVRFSPDESRMLTWSDDGTVTIFTVDGSRPAITLKADGGMVWTAEFSPDGSRVLCAYDDGTVRVWNADESGSFTLFSGEQGHTETVFDAAFSPDGSRFVTVSEDGTGRIWRTDGTGNPVILRGIDSEDWLENCDFSPDGEKVVTASASGRVWVWNVDEASQPIILRSTHDLAHIGPLTRVRFSRDSQRIITCGGLDGAVRIWNADGSGKPVALIGHGGAVLDTEFSPDGSRVITASEDGTARVWSITWDGLITHLKSLTSASLTVEERMIFLGEDESDARKAYEKAERGFGRTPLPKDWMFNYPF